MDTIDFQKREFLEVMGIPEAEGGSIALCLEAMIYLFAGAVSSLSDFKVDFLTESPFIKVTPPEILEKGQAMVDRFLSYVEKVSTILTVDMPTLSAEIQTLTPEEIQNIFEDAKEEIKNFTTYRIYEVTKLSLIHI